MNAIIVLQYSRLYRPAQRAFMCIFADDLEFQNIYCTSTEASRYPILLCTHLKYIYIASHEYHCVVALQGGLGWPCSYRAWPDDPTIYEYMTYAHIHQVHAKHGGGLSSLSNWTVGSMTSCSRRAHSHTWVTTIRTRYDLCCVAESEHDFDIISTFYEQCSIA